MTKNEFLKKAKSLGYPDRDAEHKWRVYSLLKAEHDKAGELDKFDKLFIKSELPKYVPFEETVLCDGMPFMKKYLRK